VITSEYLLLIVFVPFLLIFFWISIGVTVVPGWGKFTCTIVELTVVGILYCTDCSRSGIPGSIYDRHAALFHSYRKLRPVQPIAIMLFPPIVTKRCTPYTYVPTTTIATLAPLSESVISETGHHHRQIFSYGLHR
jgi:hypothetical protein